MIPYYKFFLCLCFFFVATGLFAGGTPCDFIVVTPEKCGTHLLTKAIEHLVDKKPFHWYVNSRSPEEVQEFLDRAKKENRFLQMHALPTKAFIRLLKKNRYKVIFLIRDPRDQIVSLVHYIESGWKYGPNIKGKRFGPLPFDDKLLEVITGERYGLSAVKDIMGRKMPWLHQDATFVYVARFEEIVGAEGGGSQERQHKAMHQMALFLGMDYSEEEIQSRSMGIFGLQGNTDTFRKGQIGEWKTAFKRRHIQAFKRVFGRELIELGYENHFNW